MAVSLILKICLEGELVIKLSLRVLAGDFHLLYMAHMVRIKWSSEVEHDV